MPDLSVSANEAWRWYAPAAPMQGVREQRFDAHRQGRLIPGVLWTAEDAVEPRPLVLTQHGGSGHKMDASIMELVASLTRDHGVAVAAIDGLVHGARRADVPDKPELLREFLAFWSADPHVDDLVADWLCVIEELVGRPEIDADRVGWCGLSMGTAYGLAVVARCRAIKAAVLGKWSSNYARSAFLAEEARKVTASTLFIQHWDDELFDRQGTLHVFDAIGAADKRLVAYPGGHFGRGAEEMSMTVSHLLKALSRAGA